MILHEKIEIHVCETSGEICELEFVEEDVSVECVPGTGVLNVTWN